MNGEEVDEGGVGRGRGWYDQKRLDNTKDNKWEGWLVNEADTNLAVKLFIMRFLMTNGALIEFNVKGCYWAFLPRGT